MKALYRIQKKLPQILSACMLSVFSLAALFTMVGAAPVNADTNPPAVNVDGTTASGVPAATASGVTSGTGTKAPATKVDNYKGLVKCSGALATNSSGSPLPEQNECNFNYFIKTVANLINWGFYIAIPIVVVLFSWAGLLYISGVEKNIDKAKGIFLNAAIGFIIMLVAFTAVHTIVGWLVDPTIGAESLLSK